MSSDPPPNSGSSSPSPTLVRNKEPHLSSFRKYVLLVLFCAAQFIDAISGSALFAAIPALVKALEISEGETAWIISAFQLTFAAFLLISGRISDIYSPKYAFVIGAFVLGVFSIGAGFSPDKITLIVLRALSGICASLTIPSALTLLVNLFPEPAEQGRALGLFGGCGAIGNALGLIIGAIFVEFATWRWVFWFVAVVSIPISGACLLLIPANAAQENRVQNPNGPRWKSLDIGGVSVLTIALVLFIFALTSVSDAGWGSARVLAPLIISVFMLAGFFYYETKIPPEVASVPPRTWFLPNFPVLVALASLPSFWWATASTTYTTLWQTVYHWSVISVALRMLPVGAFCLFVSFTSGVAKYISPKWILLFANVLMMVATILESLANAPSKYWSFVFPAFIIGSTGSMLTYTHSYIAIFKTSPPAMAGTIGAIFNCALQLGSAVGLAIDSSIQTSVEAKHGGPTGYNGRAAAFWFLLGIIGFCFVAVLIFYRVDAKPEAATEGDVELTSGSLSAEKDQEQLESSSVPLEKVRKDNSRGSDGIEVEV
ncbi:MFS general substrate transporter [Abortiporus biennis]|nr:MFS general substrate transporter [Abortiporus biennis]